MAGKNVCKLAIIFVSIGIYRKTSVSSVGANFHLDQFQLVVVRLGVGRRHVPRRQCVGRRSGSVRVVRRAAANWPAATAPSPAEQAATGRVVGGRTTTAEGRGVADGGPPGRRDETDERLTEACAHGAVEREVDAVVDERDNVHRVAERRVVRPETVLDEPAAQRQRTLRQLRHHEQHHDRHQHPLTTQYKG